MFYTIHFIQNDYTTSESLIHCVSSERTQAGVMVEEKQDPVWVRMSESGV